MRKTIAAINMTLDGFCDHTAVSPDAEIHDHFSSMLGDAGVILYGRTTYELMQYWQDVLKNPSDEKSMNDFAAAIDNVPKIVFSKTLKSTGWDTATISDKSLEEKVRELKQQAGKPIYAGSPGLIVQLMNLNLLDELQLCVHPVIVAKGLPLFEKISDRTMLKLIKTKTFNCGAINLYYDTKKSA